MLTTLTPAITTTAKSLPYPGHIVKRGDLNPNLVQLVQRRLNEVGCGPVSVDGDFGRKTELAVKLFQARFTDTDGQPLKPDGQLGALTWARLFQVEPTRSLMTLQEARTLPGRALLIADAQIGVCEEPAGSNRGPQVNQYLRAAGLDPMKGHFAWCAAFVYWCFGEAARQLGRNNPVVRTAGVLDHWRKAQKAQLPTITGVQAAQNPGLVKAGQVFIIDLGGGLGHTGFVEQVIGGKLVTIEGNTNPGGSREGIGVFRREQRKINQINKGFLDYSRA